MGLSLAACRWVTQPETALYKVCALPVYAPAADKGSPLLEFCWPEMLKANLGCLVEVAGTASYRRGAVLASMQARGKSLSQVGAAYSESAYLQSLKDVLGGAHSVAIELRQKDDACQHRAAEVARPGDTQPLHNACMYGS